MLSNASEYIAKLNSVLNPIHFHGVEYLVKSILKAWQSGKRIYFCGNGGSAGNAIHLANDFIYGAGISSKKGINAEALSANPAVITCLANDIGYENIYSVQLEAKGEAGDILIALSGSGNSKNIINAISTANSLKINTFAILGFDGGQCKKIANYSLHFPVNDMQIAEDIQLIVGHICMQALCKININNI